MSLLFPSWFAHLRRLAVAVAGFGLEGTSPAAELAPGSLESRVYLARPRDTADLFTYSHAAVLSGGARTPVNVSGASQNIQPGAYTWTRTGGSTGTLIYSTVTGPVRMELTFTASDQAAYREFVSGRTAAIVGDISFAALPRDLTPPLRNISVRNTLVAGQPVIAGFVVSGTDPRRVLVRAIGPSLALFGVTNPVATPSLAVFKGTTQIATNSGWGGDPTLAAAFSSAGAFALPVTSKDCAALLTLPPGDYTLQVRGEAGAEALLEVYLIDN